MNILKKSPSKQYSYISRYAPDTVYYHTLDNKYISSTARPLNSNTPYTEYKVQRGDTFDNIALFYYNNPTYYWIICAFNNINDPFKVLQEGMTLKIPSLASIQFIE